MLFFEYLFNDRKRERERENSEPAVYSNVHNQARLRVKRQIPSTSPGGENRIVQATLTAAPWLVLTGKLHSGFGARV